MVSRIHCCNQNEVCYILRLLELEMLFKNHLIEGYRNHMWWISVALHTIRNLTNPKKFLGFRPKVHESSDPVQAIPAVPPWPWMPGIHSCCASGLQSAVPDQLWKNQPVWQNSVCRKWPLSKDLLRKPLHNLARLWSFEAPKNVPISSYSTTATGIPPTLSEPRMCQAMQACQIQGHMSTGGLGSIDASTICL